MINKIYLRELGVSKRAEYLRLVSESLSADSVVTNLMSEKISAFEAEVKNELSFLPTSRKSELTLAINEADTVRDKLYKGFRRFLSGYTNSLDDEKAAAAIPISNFLESKKIKLNLGLNSQSAMMASVVDTLLEKYDSQLQTLGLKDVVTELKEANEAVRTKISDRYTQWSGIITGAAAAQRKKTASLYADIIDILNAHITLGDITGLDNISTSLNTITKDFAGGKTTSSSSQSDSEQTTDTTTTTTTTKYTLTLAANPTAGGTVTGGGEYVSGTSATITATAASGYTFTQWSDGNTTASRTVTISADTSLTATFTADSEDDSNSDEGFHA